MKDPARYGAVLNDLELPACNIHSLGQGWELRKATDEELAQFKPVFEHHYNSSTFNMSRTPPPHEAKIVASGTGRHLEWGLLQQSEWRYWTVHRTDPDGLSADGLVEALSLSDDEIFVDYWPNGSPDPLPSGASRIGNATAMSRFFHDVVGWDNEPETPDLDELRALVSLRAEFDETKYPAIHRMLKLFSYTTEIHERSRQKFLAHLAIIEGLLTHQPGPQDRYDTITQQLKRNIILLGNRMPAQQKLGLDTFGTTSPDKVIGKLYNYRSAIAHGGDPDSQLDIFKHKWPAPLTTLKLHRFGRTLTCRLLIAALREPRLVTDLKG